MGRSERLIFLPLFIDALDDQEKFFVNARYYERLSIARIATELGVEDKDVSVIERRAHRKLRAMMEALPEMEEDASL